MRPMPSMPLTILFAVALLLSLLVKFWLATRQMRHVAAHRGAVPAAFAQTVTLAAHQRGRGLAPRDVRPLPGARLPRSGEEGVNHAV